MDEIDLIRRGTDQADTHLRDEQQDHARQRLMNAISDERTARPRRRLYRSNVRRGLTVAAALLLLPGGYAIADGTGLINEDSPGKPGLTPITAENCEELVDDAIAKYPAQPPASKEVPKRLSCADLFPAGAGSSPEPLGLQPAP